MPSSSGLDKILKRADAVGRETLAPLAHQVDREGAWPKESLQAVLKANLGGLVVPTKNGGLGYGLFAIAQVCETLGRYCGATAMCYGMHSVGAAVIAAKASKEQEKRLLEPIASGDHITTLALSEPGTGSHFYFPETKLTKVSPDTLRVDGKKSFVTNGQHADSYVVSTVSEGPDTPPGQFSCVVVEKHAKGLSWGPPWNGFGMRGNSSTSAQLENVVIPRSQLLGEEGDQIWYVFEVITPYFLTAMAGAYLGVASAALEEAIEHLKKRSYSHSGMTLAQQPVLQHRLGTIWAALERTRQLLYNAAARTDTGDDTTLAALLSAKAEVADNCVFVVNEAMTLTGGRAYAANSSMGRHLRDIRAADVMAPTTDILRTWTGRALLGLPLLGE